MMKFMNLITAKASLLLVVNAHADINFAKLSKAPDSNRFFPISNEVMTISNLPLELYSKYFIKGLNVVKVPVSDISNLGVKKGDEIQSTKNKPYLVKEFIYMLRQEVVSESDRKKGNIILSDDEKIHEKFKRNINLYGVNGFAYVGKERKVSIDQDELVKLNNVDSADSVYKKIFAENAWKNLKNKVLKKATIGKFRIFIILEREERNMNFPIIEDPKGNLYLLGATKSLVSQDQNFLKVSKSISNSVVLKLKDPFTTDDCHYLTIITNDELSYVNLPCVDESFE